MENNDLKKEQDESSIFSFEYQVKNEEEDKAFTAFQKKYVYKRNIAVTAAFSVLAALFLFSIIKYGQDYLKCILLFISVAMIFITWYNTFRIKKYLLAALKALEDDTYEFRLFEDKFSITTIQDEEEKNSEDYVPIQPVVISLKKEGLNVMEKQGMFILILAKETIYVLPKRYMTEEEIKILKDKLSAALGDNYNVEKE